jgi:phospholipase C
MAGNQLPSINHIVQLMLENRSFDHMLGFLYPKSDNFEGLTGSESNTDASGNAVTVYQIDHTAQGAYFMPGADPGEGYSNTNEQLFRSGKPPSPPAATNTGFVTNFADAIAYDQRSRRSVQAGTTASSIMGVFPPAAGHPADASGLRPLHRGPDGYLESCQGTRQRPDRLTASRPGAARWHADAGR